MKIKNLLSRTPSILIILLGLLLTIWLRTPFLKEGSPYFYREDEAHHFNRIVNMMKSGDLNPHYFHKPSLHFYLRLPVAAAAFLWSVKKAEISNLKEIVTTDPYGIADYSFSTSHPRILIVSRAFSLLMQLACILLTFLICARLAVGFWISLFAALLLAVSPAAISESAVIGVDGVMTFFCLLTVYFGLRAYELKTWLALFWCSASAGLAISSKYNALPILVVPFLTFLSIKPLTLERGVTAFFVPLLSFLAASPFILLSLPEFLNQFAYEIWHYGVAGHIGHMAEPGLQQTRFYINWIAGNKGIGLIGASLTLCACFLLLGRIRDRKFQIAAAFPTLFFILMISQKTNFERNMLVIIPFATIFCALAICFLKKIVPSAILLAVALLSLIQPLSAAIHQRETTKNIVESRTIAAIRVQELAAQGREFAIDGSLQFARKVLEIPGVSRADFASASARKAYQDGYDYLLTSSRHMQKMLEGGFFEASENFAGYSEPQRIVKNPEITLLKRKADLVQPQLSTLLSESIPLTLYFPGKESRISYSGQPEPQLWLQKAIQQIIIKTEEAKPLPAKLTISLFSPWPDQQISIQSGSKIISVDMSGKTFLDAEIPLESEKNEQIIIVKSSRVHSPKALGISADDRRLAVAIKQASLH